MVLYYMCREEESYETTEGFGLVEHRPQGPTKGTLRLANALKVALQLELPLYY